jgi:hypothetical protein
MRHIGYDSLYQTTLAPDKIQVYHPLQLYDKKLIEVTRPSSVDTKLEWTGELDISKPGTTYMFLRDTDWLLKVKAEVLGGSFIVTMSEQSGQWPPYIIKNDTEFHFRFMQGTPTEVTKRDVSSWIHVPGK